MQFLVQTIWGHIWKIKVEKSQTNATNVTLPLLGQTIWGDIWQPIVEKSQTNATNVTLPLFGQTIWGHIWKRIVKTNLNKCSKCDFACSDPSSLKKWPFFIMSKTSHDLHKSITNIDSWNLNCIEYTNSFIFGRDKLILSARKNMVKGSKTWLG